MPGLTGLGGTYQDLVGHTRNCGPWRDILGLDGTYHEMQTWWDILGPGGTYRDLPGHAVLPGFVGLMPLNGAYYLS